MISLEWSWSEWDEWQLVTQGVMRAGSDHHEEPEDDRPRRHLDSDHDAGGNGGLGVQREGGHLQPGRVRVSAGHGDLHLQPGLELPGNIVSDITNTNWSLTRRNSPPLIDNLLLFCDSLYSFQCQEGMTMSQANLFPKHRLFVKIIEILVFNCPSSLESLQKLGDYTDPHQMWRTAQSSFCDWLFYKEIFFEETLLVTPELQEQLGLVSLEISEVIRFRAGKEGSGAHLKS